MTGSKCLTKKEDLVFVETIDPGIACAYVVKGTDHNKPAFINELVKSLKNKDKILCSPKHLGLPVLNMIGN